MDQNTWQVDKNAFGPDLEGGMDFSEEMMEKGLHSKANNANKCMKHRTV